MTSIFTLIPVKKLIESKRRLSEILEPKERRDFTLIMLKDVLKAIVSSSMIHRTVVIGSDPDVQSLASNFGAVFLLDTESGLNLALKHATRWCMENGAESLLILPSDVPLVTSEDIDRIIHLSSDECSLVLSPSKNGGTNALMQRPPDLVEPHFGPGSFERHILEASKKGMIAKVYRSLRIVLDVDSIEDLREFLKLGEGTSSYNFLKNIKVDERLKNSSTNSLM